MGSGNFNVIHHNLATHRAMAKQNWLWKQQRNSCPKPKLVDRTHIWRYWIIETRRNRKHKPVQHKGCSAVACFSSATTPFQSLSTLALQSSYPFQRASTKRGDPSYVRVAEWCVITSITLVAIFPNAITSTAVHFVEVPLPGISALTTLQHLQTDYQSTSPHPSR